MSITVYSIFISVTWFSVFVLIHTFLRRRTSFLLNWSLTPLFLIAGMSFLRLVLPLELPYTTVIRSKVLMPSLQKGLRALHIQLNGESLSVVTLIIVFWITGSVCFFFRLIWKIRRDYNVLRGYSKVMDSRVSNAMERVVKGTKPHAPYRLVLSPEVPTAMVTGFFTPTILLPSSVTALSDQDLQHILMHEWCHYLNHDLWIKLLVRLLCCIFWWNPIVYLLKLDMDQDLELKCDIAVTRNMDDAARLEYLSSLLRAAKQALRISQNKGEVPHGMVAYFAAISEGTKVKQRFHLVLGYRQKQASFFNIVFAVSLSLVFFISYAFVIQPYSLPPMDELTDVLTITPQNAYIQEYRDGTYALFVDGEYFIALTKQDMQYPPNNVLPIKK